MQLLQTILTATPAAAAETVAVQGNFDIVLQKIIDMALSAGKHILIAGVLFVVGRFIVRMLNRVVSKMLQRRHVDAGVQTFLRSLVNIVLNILLVITVIGALGVNTTSFAALLASAGVAIGMALSGNLQNLAGGLIVLLFKPYRVDDFIEVQGVQGKVREIQIFHTILVTVDNKVVYIPNGSTSSAVIVNYSREATRRVEWTIGIDYGEDVERARTAITEVLEADSRVLKEPAPFVAVSTLADSSVNIVVRVWVATENYWDVYHDTYRRIYDTFNGKGINFPFPQQTVHIVRE
ncbi:MAG: mechanosensitive ion channel [Bacteroidales bacterium]|nr:mechanosensitive ion channel [Bacteroidales bacterium]